MEKSVQDAELTFEELKKKKQQQKKTERPTPPTHVCDLFLHIYILNAPLCPPAYVKALAGHKCLYRLTCKNIDRSKLMASVMRSPSHVVVPSVSPNKAPRRGMNERDYVRE